MPVLRRERADVGKDSSRQNLPLSRRIFSRNIESDRNDDRELKDKKKTHGFLKNFSSGLLISRKLFMCLYPITVRLRTYKGVISVLIIGSLCFTLLFQSLSMASIVKRDELMSFKTVLLPKSIVKTKFQKPGPLKSQMLPDFGGFEDLVILNGEELRQIKTQVNDDDDKGKESFDDEYQFDDAYFQFDDDEVHEKTVNDENTYCRYNSWQRYHFPTCNSLHELRIIGDNKMNRFLG